MKKITAAIMTVRLLMAKTKPTLLGMNNGAAATSNITVKTKTSRLSAPRETNFGNGCVAITTVLREKEAVERRPSAAARDQHSKLKRKDYLRSTLSRRQLQGFVMLRREFTLSNNDIIHKKRSALIICGTLRNHQLVNMRWLISGSDKPSLLSCI